MKIRALAAGLGLWAVAATAPASPTLINADVVSGRAAFDAWVLDGGGQVALQPMLVLREAVNHWDFDDFTISTPNGATHLIAKDYAGLRAAHGAGALSGMAIGLVPNNPAPEWGLLFTFDQPVNAFGIEVGDWGTCCFASSLYIAFDGGATRLVATARDADDNPGVGAYQAYTNFVGAFDRSGSFTRVMFYGDGLGEYMVAGGTIRYARLPLLDAAPPDSPGGPGGPGQLAEPASLALAAAALGLTLAARRRRPARGPMTHAPGPVGRTRIAG